MLSQQRVTVSLPTQNEEVIHVRTTSQAELDQKTIYNTLGISSDKVGKRKTRVAIK